MRTSARIGAALAMATLGAALAACDRQDMARADREGAAVGQKSTEVLATAKEKLKEAGARTQQTLEHGAQKLRAATADDGNANSDGNGNGGSASASNGGTGAGVHDDRWSDAAITASIKADYLKDPDLSVFKIDVDTQDGVVTLNGLAQDEAAKKRAESLAQGIKGVREVRNHLVIKKA